MSASTSGSESTAPSFLNLDYVRFNSISKSRDLGRLDELAARFDGRIGAQVGSPTLFFRVQTTARGRVGIRNITAAPYSRQVRVAISDQQSKSLPLDESGFAVINGSTRLAKGTYYFTVSTDEWEATPFTALLVVEGIRRPQGAASNSLEPALSLRRWRFEGAAAGQLLPEGLLRPAGLIKPLQGAASGSLEGELTLAILGGVATGEMAPEGRIAATFRAEGSAVLGAPCEGDLRVYRLRGAATLDAPARATIRKRRRSGYDY